MISIKNARSRFSVPPRLLLAIIPSDNTVINTLRDTYDIDVRDIIANKSTIDVSFIIPELTLTTRNITQGLESEETSANAVLYFRIYSDNEKTNLVAFEQIPIALTVTASTNFVTTSLKGEAVITYPPLIDLVIDYLWLRAQEYCESINCGSCERDCVAEAEANNPYRTCAFNCDNIAASNNPYEECVPCEGLEFFNPVCQGRRIACEARNAEITARRANDFAECTLQFAGCERFNVGVTAARGAYIAQCGIEIAACESVRALCFNRVNACNILASNVPLLKSILRATIPPGAKAACTLGIESDYTCLVEGDDIRYPFTFAPSVGRRRVGSIRIADANYGDLQAELLSNCRTAYARPGTIIRVNDQQIGDITLNMAACYLRSTGSIAGKVLISATGGADILYYGNLLRTQTGVELSNAILSVPDELVSNFRFITDFLTFDSIELSNSIIRTLGLQPIFGRDVLDLLEMQVTEARVGSCQKCKR